MEQVNLFDNPVNDGFSNVRPPLAERMKPRTLDDFIGQEHVMEKGGLRMMIEQDTLSSIILYGPPGTGKTSLARIVASTTKSDFISINAVSAGIKDIKEAAARGRDNQALYGRRTVLFIDEVHRFNKLQQDALLPYVESGMLILIGATTENPYFEVNSALISRSMVLRLDKLTVDDIVTILQRAISSERGLLTFSLDVPSEVLMSIARLADGDARRALTLLETAVNRKASLSGEISLTEEDIVGARKLGFANKADNHYDLASAFIKSMRGSDASAAVFYLGLLIESGEDPVFIARRIVIAAAEDVGNADPMALVVANAAAQAALFVGFPEARIILSQAATYVATAPKSNAAYLAINEAIRDVQSGVDTAMPYYLKDGTSQRLEKRYAMSGRGQTDDTVGRKPVVLQKGAAQLAKERQADGTDDTVGQAVCEMFPKDGKTSEQPAATKGMPIRETDRFYRYPHDYDGGYVEQQYLPDGVKEKVYYKPKDIGFEKTIIERLENKGLL